MIEHYLIEEKTKAAFINQLDKYINDGWMSIGDPSFPSVSFDGNIGYRYIQLMQRSKHDINE